MAARIAVFIRHGDYQQLPAVPSAHQPFALTNKGQRQAVHCARLVLDMAKQYHWVINPQIHSSNLLRAWQTADIIRKELNQECFIQGYDSLAERSMGSAANLTVQQIEQVLKDDPRFSAPPENWKSNSLYRLPLQGGESLIDAGLRIAEHVRLTMQQLQPQTNGVMQLFVGHGAAFRHAAYQLGVLTFEEIAKLSMYHASPVAIQVVPEKSWRHVAGDWKIRPVKDRELD